METDVFGYTKSEPGKYVLSADYASVYFANTPGGVTVAADMAGLVQSAAVSYQQNVQPRFEVGSSNLYWTVGQSLGTAQLGRIVGDKGLLAGINFGANPNSLLKGILGGVEYKIGRTNLQGVAVKQDVLVLRGCVLSAIGESFSVGGLDVQEALTIQAALVKRGLRT
jgi:hypothetical protein